MDHATAPEPYVATPPSGITVLDALAARLESDPDGPYLEVDGTALTARELDRAANRAAHVLAQANVSHGDRVATLLENSPAQVVSFFAALKLGAIQVPINTAYKGAFLTHVLADSGARVLVIQGDFGDRLGLVEGADVPELSTVFVTGPAEPSPRGDAGDRARSGEESSGAPEWSRQDWDAGCAAAPDTPPPDPGLRPSDLACFIYTAGTTGPSKGCMLPHGYVVALGEQIARAWQRRADDVVITPLPLFHFNAISVCVVGTLLVGGRSVIVRRFSVSGFWPEVKRTGATMASLLGSLAILLGNAPDHRDQTGHRLRLCAAAPMPPATDQQWRERFGCETFSAGFGLTEASLLALLPAGESNRPGAAGKVNTAEFDVAILDDDDRRLPPGEVGELVCRPTGPNLMFAGYWRRPEDTLGALRNLWFHTGDLCRVDEDGFLYFVDRKKDYLRRRGENISSFEMERVFVGHPDVRDVAVHAVPSAQGEDDVKVTAVLVEGSTLIPENLCAWCVERVPYFAVPRYIEFRADLPRNPVGRVLKYQLRDDGVTATTWDREATGFTIERR